MKKIALISMISVALIGSLPSDAHAAKRMSYDLCKNAINDQLPDDCLVSQEKRVMLMTKNSKAGYWQRLAQGFTLASLAVLGVGYWSMKDWTTPSIYATSPAYLYTLLSFVFFGASLLIDRYTQSQFNEIVAELAEPHK